MKLCMDSARQDLLHTTQASTHWLQMILQVPVVVDGDHAVHESFEIARYLETTYPDAPSLFGGEGGEAGCLFTNAFADAVLMRNFRPLPDFSYPLNVGRGCQCCQYRLFYLPASFILSLWLCQPEAFTTALILHADYFPLIIADIHSTLAEKDKDYFRTSREKMFGSKLEDLQLGREVRFRCSFPSSSSKGLARCSKESQSLLPKRKHTIALPRELTRPFWRSSGCRRSIQRGCLYKAD